LEQKVKSPCPLVLSVKVMISVASEQGSSGSLNSCPNWVKQETGGLAKTLTEIVEMTQLQKCSKSSLRSPD